MGGAASSFSSAQIFQPLSSGLDRTPPPWVAKIPSFCFFGGFGFLLGQHGLLLLLLLLLFLFWLLFHFSRVFLGERHFYLILQNAQNDVKALKYETELFFAAISLDAAASQGGVIPAILLNFPQLSAMPATSAPFRIFLHFLVPPSIRKTWKWKLQRSGNEVNEAWRFLQWFTRQRGDTSILFAFCCTFPQFWQNGTNLAFFFEFLLQIISTSRNFVFAPGFFPLKTICFVKSCKPIGLFFLEFFSTRKFHIFGFDVSQDYRNDVFFGCVC